MKKKKKTLKISSKTFEQFEDDSVEKLEKFKEGEDVSHSLSFEDPTRLRKLLTEKRIEIIQHLMENDVDSIGELSEQLDRGIKEVSKDLTTLEEYGIVRIEKQGRKKKPSVPYERIEIDIGIEAANHDAEKEPA